MNVRATVLIDEDAETLVADDTMLAIRQRGHVEIWNGAGELHLGNLPENATANDIKIAYAFYQNGFSEGCVFGRHDQQVRLRAALGMRA